MKTAETLNSGQVPAAELERLRSGFQWDIADHAKFVNGVWLVERPNQPAVHFPDQAHLHLAKIEEVSFWFRHRNFIVGDLVDRFAPGAAFWDVGSGNGYVAAHLARRGAEVVAVEPGIHGAVCAAAREIPSICGFFEELLLPAAGLQAAGCFDVLEHLPDPARLLSAFAETLAPGGKLFVTVPALQSLWSQVDEVSGHHRRYSLEELRTVVEKSGFSTLFASYFFACLVPPLYLLRTLPYRRGKVRPPEALLHQETQRLDVSRSSVGSRALNIVLGLERKFVRHGALPFGTSLIGVFERAI